MEYKVGDLVIGKVTGIQPYGIFVRITKEISGLIHISEITYGFVSNINKFFKTGQEIKAVIIKVSSEHQLHLSTKTLKKASVKSNNMYKKTKINNLVFKKDFETIRELLPNWLDEVKKNYDKN